MSLQSIIDSPLPGCLDVAREHGNWATLYESMLSRLELVHTRRIANSILHEIFEEAKKSLDHREYILNEMAYEIRNGMAGSLKTTNEVFESMALQQWVKILLISHHEDLVLDWLKTVQENRSKRKVNF